jgi:heptosyltransferase-1
LKAIFSGEWKRFKQALREEHYDLILDSQGLLKSAWLASKAKGPRVGYDKDSAREPLASGFYQKKFFVDPDQHAIKRQRALFGAALGYTVPASEPDSALSIKWEPDRERPYVFFLHGTSWPSKEWPEQNWIELAKLAIADGYQVKLTWGNQREKERAERISAATGGVVIPRMDLSKIVRELAGASRVFGVDSGFAHLAAAIRLSIVAIYGATNIYKTGAVGSKKLVSKKDCSPCNARLCRFGGEPICMRDLKASLVYFL